MRGGKECANRRLRRESSCKSNARRLRIVGLIAMRMRPSTRLLFFPLVLGFACQPASTTQSVPLPEGSTWIAHRGDSAHAPENSLAAIRAAFELTPAPHFVEIDVHASRDGELVVIHDDDLARTTGTSGRVSSSDWAQLTKLKAGYSEKFGEEFADEPLPRLSDVLDLAAKYQGSIMIEVKARSAGRAVGQLLLERGEIAQHLVASFEAAAIVGAAMTAPGVRTLYLVGNPGPADLELAQKLGASILGCHRDHAQPELLRAVQAAGLKLWVYTVNDRDGGLQLLSMGADGVISDRVGALRLEVEAVMSKRAAQAR
jgi:glycerophosphoryl diester phosphodiesterase